MLVKTREWIEEEAKKTSWVVEVRDTDSLGGEFAEVFDVTIAPDAISFSLRNTFSSGLLHQVCFEVDTSYTRKTERGAQFLPREYVIRNGQTQRISFAFPTGHSLPSDVEEVKIFMRQFIRC